MSSLSCRANAVAAKSYSFDAQDHVVGVGWSPDSARVAALTGSGTLFILDARDVNVVHELPEAHTVGSITLDWAEGGLGTGGRAGNVRLWEPSRGTGLVP